jgi:hypothetical protein
MAVYSNLTIDQGASFSANIDVTDSDGDALNLDGYSVAGQIRKTYSSTTAVDFTASIINASAGVVQISLSATQTNNMKAGRYVYDVEINSGGTITRVVEGQVEVTPGVTRD